MKTRLCLASLTLALAASLAPEARAAQSFDACTGFIAALPVVISTQGVWCFNKDLATAIAAGNAITINANNVTIDCNDFKLGGLAAGVGTATIGIRSQNRLNATVRNCNIRGFYAGVVLDGEVSGGHVVANSRFEANTYAGIGVSGSGSTIRGNLVLDSGGSTFQSQVAGIVAFGQVDVIDNTVDGVQPAAESGGSGVGIGLYNLGGGSISGNRVRDVGFDGMGGYTGIVAGDGGNAAITGNHLDASGFIAPSGGFGIFCGGEGQRIRDNIINGFPTAALFCGDAGGNDAYPVIN